LDQFLADGRNIFIAINAINGEFADNHIVTSFANTNLIEWLALKGIKIDKKLIIDANCARVGIQQKNGGSAVNNQIPLPPIPIITNFGDHPAVRDLENVMLPFLSPVRLHDGSTLQFISLAKTSEKSGLLDAPGVTNVIREWEEKDFPLNGITIAAEISGPIHGEKNARIIIVSNGNFAVSSVGSNPTKPQQANVDMAVNAIAYLSDTSSLNALDSPFLSEHTINIIHTIPDKQFNSMLVSTGIQAVDDFSKQVLHPGIDWENAVIEQVTYDILDNKQIETANIRIRFTAESKEYTLVCNDVYKLNGQWVFLHSPELI
jgi:hypothetical protein